MIGKWAILVLVLLSSPMIQNCGGGGGKSDVLIADQLLNDGWDAIAIGNYDTAASKFMQTMRMPVTDAQRINSYNGLGWALAKDGKILEAIQYFEIAAPLENEAKVGLAAALIYRRQTTADYIRAAELLGNMPPERFAPVRPGLGLSAAKVHALAAIAYALAGDPENSERYMNKAAALDSMSIGTTVDKIDDAFLLLGWKR